MEAAPSDADLILRVDDDVVMTPTSSSSSWGDVHSVNSPDRRRGRLLSGAMDEALDLNQALTDPEWAPRILDPAWPLVDGGSRATSIDSAN